MPKTRIYRYYKFRIYPDDEQKKQLEKTFGCCRKIWNLMLEDRILHYAMDKSSVDRSPAYYKQEYPYLRDVDSSALHNTYLNLRKAFDDFFAQKRYFPRFKNKYKCRFAYKTSVINNNSRIEDEKLILPKVPGKIKINMHRELPEDSRIVSVTIIRQAKTVYYASLNMAVIADIPEKKPLLVETSSALDGRIGSICITSDGTELTLPDTKKLQQRLQREKNRLNNKEYGSKNYEKQKKRISKLQNRITNINHNALHLMSHKLAAQNDNVFIDSEKHKLTKTEKRNRSAKTGYGYLKKMLSYKLEDKGGSLIPLETKMKSVRTCPRCGMKNPIGRIKDCINCGYDIESNVNRAKIIMMQAELLIEKKNKKEAQEKVNNL